MQENTDTELHLVIDDLLQENAGTVRSSVSTPVLETVRVPIGVSYLRSGAPAKELITATPSDGCPAIEPLPRGPQPRLLLLAGRGVPAPTVNGRSAPRVCLLRVGDQVLLDDGRLLHVTAFHSPQIGPHAEQSAGPLCPICRAPFGPGRRVFTCPCGSKMHYDDPADIPRDECLLCATFADACGKCHRPIHLSGGFQYVPDCN